jgi:hypothetical protein
MAQVTGTISDGDKVLFQDIPMSLRPTSGVLKGFEGEFIIPAGGSYLSPGLSFRITCSDGRSGTILIVAARSGSSPGFLVEFQTQGAFQ